MALGLVDLTVTGYSLIGGLVGVDVDDDASIEASYFLDPEDGSDPSGMLGMPLPRTAFGDLASFDGAWDFDATWVMQDFVAPDFRRPTLIENPEAP